MVYFNVVLNINSTALTVFKEGTVFLCLAFIHNSFNTIADVVFNPYRLDILCFFVSGTPKALASRTVKALLFLYFKYSSNVIIYYLLYYIELLQLSYLIIVYLLIILHGVKHYILTILK